MTIDVVIGNGFAPGDLNLDGTLDGDDILQFVAGWRSDTSSLSALDAIRQGDLNLDRIPNLAIGMDVDVRCLTVEIYGGGHED